jgi:DUF917 family protein
MNNKGEIIYKAPDLIVVIDDSLKPVHNTEWNNRNGQSIKILLIPAKGYWRKKIGKKLWNHLFKRL